MHLQLINMDLQENTIIKNIWSIHSQLHVPKHLHKIV
jgi:hypothetical protein